MNVTTTLRGTLVFAGVFTLALGGPIGCSKNSSSRGSTSAGITNSAGFVNTGPLLTPRVHHTATLLADGRILVAGGLVNQTDATATVEIFDPATGQSTAAAPMTTARMHHRAVLLPTRRVLVIGGQTSRYGAGLVSTELYDPTSNTWIPGPNMAQGRSGAAVAAFDQGKQVLIAGGATWSSNAPSTLDTAELYNADANTVTLVTNRMTSPRCCGEAFTQLNGQILLTSGFKAVITGEPAPSEVYDIPSKIFIPVAMAERRAEAAVVQIGNTIESIGGVNTASQTLISAESFNGQVWSPAAPLVQARANASASLLSNGVDVLVAGGRNGTSALATAELRPGSVTPTMPLAESRYDHTATAVGDVVYLIGGLTDGEQILASIEAFAPAGTPVPGAGGAKGSRANGQAPLPANGALTISAVSPLSGNVGDTVTITGTGFDPLVTNNVVRFNGVVAMVLSVNTTNPLANTLTVRVPTGATTGVVSVQIGVYNAAGPVFTVNGTGGTGAVPRILFVLPNSAKPFFPVSITGQDFGPQPVVTFNGVPTINVLNLSTKNLPFVGSISELIVLVPPGATSGPLVVNNGGMMSNPFYFTVN